MVYILEIIIYIIEMDKLRNIDFQGLGKMAQENFQKVSTAAS